MKIKMTFIILLSILFAVDNCLSQSISWDEFGNISYEQELQIGNEFPLLDYEISTEDILLNGELRSTRPDVDDFEGTGGEIVVPVGNGFSILIILGLGYFLYQRKKIRGRVLE